jgi:dolichol-phosphate mannosyltransferase
MFSIVVPARDEPGLPDFLASIHDAMTGIPTPYEVLVVQGDREKGARYTPRLPHERSIWTYGDSLERSILNGFSHSRGERILVMDADGSHPAAMIGELYRALDDYEMAVGSRFADGAEFDGSPYRRLVTWGFRQVARQAGSRLRDPMSGFFAVRREVVDRCRFKPLRWKTALELELRAHPRVVEIPIRFVERGAGRSKAGAGVGLSLLWQLQWEGWD